MQKNDRKGTSSWLGIGDLSEGDLLEVRKSEVQRPEEGGQNISVLQTYVYEGTI